MGIISGQPALGFSKDGEPGGAMKSSALPLPSVLHEETKPSALLRLLLLRKKKKKKQFGGMRLQVHPTCHPPVWEPRAEGGQGVASLPLPKRPAQASQLQVLAPRGEKTTCKCKKQVTK